jgi:vancomycin resistance protein VanJ
MSVERRRAWRSVPTMLRIGVAAVISSTALVIAAQHLVPGEAHWLELSRYLPYYVPLLPGIAALAASFWLGRGWVAASLANLALLATLGMGLQWHGGDDGAERVRVMTYNVKVGYAVRQRSGVQALALEVARYDPDILVTQDADGLLGDRGAPGVSGGPPVFGLPNVYALGQYIVASRFPLRGCGTGQIAIRGDKHRYLRCVVDVRGADLNLVTAHFQSPRAGLIAARREGLDGGDEWQRNYEGRLIQAGALARDLASIGRPLVVAGDLNAPESSPVIQTLLAGGLRDAFSSAGRGYGYTYGHSQRYGLDFLRIDHILVSHDIGVIAAFAGQSDASEHRAVIADLVLRR